MMLRKTLSRKQIVVVILILQFIPLVLFPPASFSPDTQEWWLPVLLAILDAVGIFGLFVRHTLELWPWYLISFAQGFNIISRLMMLMPHSIIVLNGVQSVNVIYISLTMISMLLSAFILWYVELPEVRMTVVARS